MAKRSIARAKKGAAATAGATAGKKEVGRPRDSAVSDGRSGFGADAGRGSGNRHVPKHDDLILTLDSESEGDAGTGGGDEYQADDDDDDDGDTRGTDGVIEEDDDKGGQSAGSGLRGTNSALVASSSTSSASALPTAKANGPARLSAREKVVDPKDKAAGRRQGRRGGTEDDAAAVQGETEHDAPKLDAAFDFDADDDVVGGFEHGMGGWDFDVAARKSSARNGTVDAGGQTGEADGVDGIIERRRKELGLETIEMSSDGEEEEDAGQDGATADEEQEESDPDEFGGGLRKRAAEDDEDESEDDAEDNGSDASSDDAQLRGRSDEKSSDEDEDDDEESEAQKARKAAFFATDSIGMEGVEASTDQASAKRAKPSTATFDSLALSRPMMRSLAALGFHTPTPIQRATIPHALAGRDVVANAVTGSGKTAAFMIPILERLSRRLAAAAAAREVARTSVLVLTPTRELAVQCCQVGRALAKNATEVRFCLCVGGLSLKAQEAELKQRPDIVIATPGRLIDHVRNSASFGLEDLQILVLDEADRMLEEGFAAELNEILSLAPRASSGTRQTMLFSATMTDDVDELVRLSLRKPVRLFVDPKKSANRRLVQEFMRVRGATAAATAATATTSNGDDEGATSSTVAPRRTEDEARAALLFALCTRTFRHEVIVFVRSKKLAHQLKVMFGLLGLSAAELHGDLSQEQRLRSLQDFKDGRTDFLLATDLASRGLDIKGVQTVINYDMPAQFEQYLHRVGRTARAGRAGRAVTLVGEADRRLLKTVLKRTPAEQVKHRLVPAEVTSSLAVRLESLKPEVQAVLREEKEAKAMELAQRELQRTENLVEHRDEILARPKRTWFQSEKDKAEAKNLSAAEHAAKMGSRRALEEELARSKAAAKKAPTDKYAGLSRRKKRARMMRDEVAAEGEQHAINASIRAAKKATRPKELGKPEPRPSKRTAAANAKSKKQRSTTSSKSVGKKGAGVKGAPGGAAGGGGGGSGGGGGKAKARFARDLGERRSAKDGGGKASSPGGRAKSTKGPPQGKRPAAAKVAGKR